MSNRGFKPQKIRRGMYLIITLFLYRQNSIELIGDFLRIEMEERCYLHYD